MGRACCRGACCFIFASYYRASSCWYFRWYRPSSTMKTISNSNGYGIRRLPARVRNMFDGLRPSADGVPGPDDARTLELEAAERGAA
jgi:hypothetical protein